MSQTTLPGSNQPETNIQIDQYSHEDFQIKQGEYKYSTPLSEFIPISKAVGGFDCDPCASKKSRLAKTNIRESGGLQHDWDKHNRIWVNHPYAKYEPPKWLSKAYNCDAELVVALSQANPSANWFHDYILKADLICFPDERIEFVGFDKGADFSSVYSVFGDYPAELREHFESKGWVITSEGGFNEILVQNALKENEGLLPELSLADECLVEFKNRIDVNGINSQFLTVAPLSRRIIGGPVPGGANQGLTSANDFDDPYFELTTIYQHTDGTESWIVLTQRLANPKEIHCYIHTDMGIHKTPIDRVKANKDYQSTSPPQSDMVVC